MISSPKTPEGKAWNIACHRAMAIIQNYREGFGLFQIAKRLKQGDLNA